MTLYEDLTDPVTGLTIGIMAGMTVDIIASVIDHYKSGKTFDEYRKYDYAVGSGTGIGCTLTFMPDFFPFALGTSIGYWSSYIFSSFIRNPPIKKIKNRLRRTQRLELQYNERFVTPHTTL